MSEIYTVQILLVEDDDVHAEAVERTFFKAKISNPIIRARDGIEALEMLRGVSGTPKLARPYIILLDLKMPRMNGLEFLENIRKDPDLTDSVIFVLTTSQNERDKTAAYAHFVAGYIVKSKVGQEFKNLIGMLDNYWRIVELPDGSKRCEFDHSS